MPPMHRASASALAAALATGLFACREATAVDNTTLLPIVPNGSGANGCVTPDNALAQAPQAVPLATLPVGPMSQVTAAAGGALLYATGADATVVEIDVSDPSAPVETLLLAPGDVAALLAEDGILDAPVLSGIAVLDGERLVVVEHTANVLLAVDRAAPGVVALLAGLPSTVPGNADGQASGQLLLRARFSFEEPCQVVPAGESGGELYIADSGNDTVRILAGNQVSTLAGFGTPFTFDGDLTQAGFDTPSGLSASCANTLYVTELGGTEGGQRLRSLFLLAQPTLLGDLAGGVDTVTGDGVDATTEGVTTSAPSGAIAQLSRPMSPLATSGGQVYWIDVGTGVLRRLAGEAVDCPLFPDCAAAVAAPSFTPGGTCSLTQTADGTLWVLDAAAATLWRLPQ